MTLACCGNLQRWGAGWFNLNGTEHGYARGGYGICLLCYSKRPHFNPSFPPRSCPVSCPFRRRVIHKIFTVTHKRLTVDGSRVLQTDRGVGSKVGGWGEKNLRVILLSIPPPQKHTQYYPSLSLLQSNQFVLFAQARKLLLQQGDSPAQAQGALPLHYRRRHGVTIIIRLVSAQLRLVGRPLPAHEGRASQGHEVHLTGTSGAHRGEEDLDGRDNGESLCVFAWPLNHLGNIFLIDTSKKSQRSCVLI